MKIKAGFISNSSSSSMVVCLRKDFMLSLADLTNQVLGDYDVEDPDDPAFKQELLESLQAGIETLKQGGEITQYDDEDVYRGLVTIFNDTRRGSVFASVDHGPDMGAIIGIDIDVLSHRLDLKQKE